MKTTLFRSIFFSLAACFATVAPSQEAGSESPGLDGYWQAFVGGGHYMVRLGSIASVSKHQYIVDGAARVVEVTIATNSSVAARFYYLEPVGTSGGSLAMPQEALKRLQQMATEASNRSGVMDPNLARSAVVKSYPLTTHAHTVEYILTSEAALDSLYNSLTRAVADPRRGVAWRGQ